MITEILVFIFTTIVFYALYTYKRGHYYFQSRGLKYIPGVPLFGNTLRSTFGGHHMIYDINQVYEAFPNEKYVGYMEGTAPHVLVRDPALIRQLTVKDFDHFLDHKSFFTDQIFTDSLLMMKGDRWRNMRATLSPAFTGSKMKQMVPFMNEISLNIVEYLKEKEGETINVDDIIRRYSNDVIASTAFGIQVNSLRDPDNEFYRTGQAVMTFNFYQRMKMVFMAMFPGLAKHTDIFPQSATEFFKRIVKETMEYREKNNIERPDMIQLLMEAKKGTLKAQGEDKLDKIGFATTEEIEVKPQSEKSDWTQDELAAQAFLFFAAGFESAASAIALAIHELAINPAVQGKLHEEVKQAHDKHGRVNYEVIQGMKYLDCVFSETLRKWSPAIVMDRVCVRPYTLPPASEGAKPVKLNVGDVLYNVVNSLQLDAQYYPDPLKFDPSRFSDERKHEIQPTTYMPFGNGPRNCIASRFAILEAKVLMFHLILNFELLKTEQTLDPIELRAGDFSIKVKGGSYVKCRARK